MIIIVFLDGGFYNSGYLWSFGYIVTTFFILGKVIGTIAYFFVLSVNATFFGISLFNLIQLPIRRELNAIYLLVFGILGIIAYNQEKYRKNTELIIKKSAEEFEAIAKKLNKNITTINEELEMAKNIQEAIIPKNFPKSDIIDISGSYIPMEGLGGDYYDVIEISENKLGFVIADVSGHGLPSALIASMAKILFVNHSKVFNSAGEILNLVNRELYYAMRGSEYPSSFYLTAFYCIVDIENKTLQYTNAGHNNMYLLKKNKELKILKANSPIIGVFDKLQYNEHIEELDIGDKLILYTDGLTEALNDNEEFFGEGRLKQMIIKYSELPAKELVNKIMNEIDNFTKNSAPKDDRTILIADIVSDKARIIIDLGIAKEKQEDIIGHDDVSRKFREMNEKFADAVNYFTEEKFDMSEKILLELYNKYNRKVDNLRVLNLLGFTYYKLGKYEDTLRIWKEAIELNPNDKILQRNIKLLSSKHYANLKM